MQNIKTSTLSKLLHQFQPNFAQWQRPPSTLRGWSQYDHTDVCEVCEQCLTGRNTSCNEKSTIKDKFYLIFTRSRLYFLW